MNIFQRDKDNPAPEVTKAERTDDMLKFRELRGKKANEIRWEAMKLLDWTKDAEVIEKLADVDNPRFFTSRSPEEAVAAIRENIERDKRFNQMCEEYMLEHAQELVDQLNK